MHKMMSYQLTYQKIVTNEMESIPKKAVIPVCGNDMTFVKPCYGDTPEPEANQPLCCSDFDPRRNEDRVFQNKSLNKLLTRLKESLPNIGL